MVAFGVWLVPRTIGAHSGLAKRNGELMSRVRRLTATRVDAVDSAAAANSGGWNATYMTVRRHGWSRWVSPCVLPSG